MEWRQKCFFLSKCAALLSALYLVSYIYRWKYKMDHSDNMEYDVQLRHHFNLMRPFPFFTILLLQTMESESSFHLLSFTVKHRWQYYWEILLRLSQEKMLRYPISLSLFLVLTQDSGTFTLLTTKGHAGRWNVTFQENQVIWGTKGII